MTQRIARARPVLMLLAWISVGSSSSTLDLAPRFDPYVLASEGLVLPLDANRSFHHPGGGLVVTDDVVRFCMTEMSTTIGVERCHDGLMHHLRAAYPQVVVRPVLPLHERIRMVLPVDGGEVLFGDPLQVSIDFPHIPFGRTRYGLLFVNGIAYPQQGDVWCPLPTSQDGPCPNRPDGDYETPNVNFAFTPKSIGHMHLQFFLIDRDHRPILVEGHWEFVSATVKVVDPLHHGVERKLLAAGFAELDMALPTLHSPSALEVALVCASMSESKGLWPVELGTHHFQMQLHTLSSFRSQPPNARRKQRYRLSAQTTVHRAAHRGGDLWRILTHACSLPGSAAAQWIADLCGDRQALRCIEGMSRTAWLPPLAMEWIADARARNGSFHTRATGGKRHGLVVAADASQAKFPPAPISLWQRVWHVYSLDWHTAIVRDVQFVLTRVLGLRVNLTEQSFATLCHHRSACMKDPRLMSHPKWVGSPSAVCGVHKLGLCDSKCSSRAAREQFFDAFKDDPVIQQTDFFVCSVPTAVCEIFLPFNKTIIAVNAFRIEYGRENPRAFQLWARHLELLHSSPLHVLITNSLSDQLNTEYWTGVKPPVVESICTYYASTYLPDSAHNEILVGLKSFNVSHEGPDHFQDMILRMNAEQSSPLPMAKLNVKYKNGRVDFATLATHPAFIDIPYMCVLRSYLEAR